MTATVQRNDDTGDSTVHSESSFTDMARNKPDAMIAYLRSDAEPGALTHAAEIAGLEMSGPLVTAALIELLAHTRPVVREGALLGLSYHIGDAAVLAAVRRVAEEDECETIRQVAEGVLP